MAYKTVPVDTVALDILLAGGPHTQRRLQALHAYVERTISGGDCPNCGNHGPHDTNGESGRDLSFCCTACGEQWDAYPERG